MFEDYTVAVKVKLFNEVSGGLVLMSKQFEGLTAKALLFQGHVKKIQSLMTTGFAMLGAGGALAAPFLYGISKAAELQKQMIGIQLATHGTTEQMEKMRYAMERASSTTMFSTLQVAGIAKIIATANSFNATQITSVLPEYTKFADVQYLLKGTNYETSTAEAVKLAHTAKIYDPAGLAKYLDTLAKASLLSSGNITQLGNALKYSQGMGQSILGIEPNDMVILSAFMNRLGLSGSRGGTNLIAALGRTIPGVFGSGLLRGKSYEALSAMGMVDSKGYSKFFVNGKFDPFSFIQGLAHYTSTEFAKDPLHARENVYRNLQHGFGTEGSRVASLLTTPAALKMLLQMEAQFEKLANVGAMQDVYVQQSVSQQYQTALTNFQNLFIELGYNLLPLATRALKAVNHELDILIPWMRAHKKEVLELSKAFLALAASMAIIGLINAVGASFVALSGILRGILAITGISGVSAGIAGAGAGLAARTAALGTTVGVAAGSAYAGYEAGSWLNNKYHLSDTIGGYFFDQMHPEQRLLTAPSAPTDIAKPTTAQPLVIQISGRTLLQTLIPDMSNSLYHAQIQAPNRFNPSITPSVPGTSSPYGS